MLHAYPLHATAPDPHGLHDKAVWIDLESPSDDEIAAVQAMTGLRVPGLRDLSEIEFSSRLRREGEALYLSAPLVSQADTADAALSPVGFVLAPGRLITVRFASFVAFDTAVAGLAPDDTASGVAAFVKLLEAIVDRQADLLEKASGELDAISRRVFRADKAQTRHAVRSTAVQRTALSQVGSLGDRLSQIRDALLGIERIVAFVCEIKRGRHDEAIAQRLNALHADVTSLNDYEGRLSDKIQFLLDAVLGFISVQQNDIFKVLTVASVVGIPPTLVASMYGMNFAGMPELHWHYGYAYGLALIAVSTLIPIAWFKWRGWI
jgi:magnesium transporter